MNRIDAKLEETRGAKRAALMPYLPLGFPTIDLSVELIRTAEEAGADLLELGIPFSDPLADGPVIAHATQVALRNGMTMGKCLETVRAARRAGVFIPLVLMGYYNPILAFGIEDFVRAAKDAGADGFIVPDLPPEEAGSLQDAATRCGRNLVFLAAPTSTPERLAIIAEATHGFIYLVSVTGVTGARDHLAKGLSDLVARLRALTDKPICVGFGISGASSARQVAAYADGIIVGSALVSRIGESTEPCGTAKSFISDLRAAIDI